MEISALAGKAAGWLLTLVRSMWRKFRYGFRLSLSLSWEGPGSYVHGKQIKQWRAIELKITASKDEEFVIAKGSLEGRKMGSSKWKAIDNLEDHIHFPIQVEKNRQTTELVSGSPIAAKLQDIFAKDEQIEIRFIGDDYYGSQAKSDVLVVTIPELLQVEFR